MSAPAPVRRLVAASADAVSAALARDAGALSEAAARLGAMDPELVRVVLGHALGAVLASRHPGGLEGEELAAVLTGTVTRAGPWWPVDPQVALAVLLGAVGAHAEDVDALDPRAVAAHAALVVAQVMTPVRPPGDARGAQEGPSAEEVAAVDRAVLAHLGDAVAELERAQSVEMP